MKFSLKAPRLKYVKEVRVLLDHFTTGQIRGARGSRPFKLVNEIMSLTKVGIYALGVTKIH